MKAFRAALLFRPDARHCKYILHSSAQSAGMSPAIHVVLQSATDTSRAATPHLTSEYTAAKYLTRCIGCWCTCFANELHTSHK